MILTPEQYKNSHVSTSEFNPVTQAQNALESIDVGIKQFDEQLLEEKKSPGTYSQEALHQMIRDRQRFVKARELMYEVLRDC